MDWHFGFTQGKRGILTNRLVKSQVTVFWVSMSALEAALGERMEKLAEAKSKKQKAQVRLLVDPKYHSDSFGGYFHCLCSFQRLQLP